METIYDVDYFSAKYKAIPNVQWLERSQGELDTEGKMPHCAIGWCKNNRNEYGCSLAQNSKEAYSLLKLFVDAGIGEKSDATGWVIADINNGNHKNYKQATPKERILAALSDVKKFQQSQKSETIVIEKIKYVSISEIIKKEISLIAN